MGLLTSAEGSMPVFTTSAPMSPSTQSIWLLSVSAGTVWKPRTPAANQKDQQPSRAETSQSVRKAGTVVCNVVLPVACQDQDMRMT